MHVIQNVVGEVQSVMDKTIGWKTISISYKNLFRSFKRFV